ncbi:MAG: tetratricopeptide repeat protein [Elusimicrobiota bacterium]|jgi:tetratricopeptide (TPR) repeat protein|nr:tetratricopeptide repeat protein [Elusimicrobiota bacterium]
MKKIFFVIFALLFIPSICVCSDNLDEQLELKRGKIFLFSNPQSPTSLTGMDLSVNTLNMSAIVQANAGIREMEMSLIINPDPIIYAYSLGNIYVVLREFDKALASYDKAISLDKNLYAAYFNKGYVLYYLGKTEEALEYINKAILLNPNIDGMYIGKADILDNIGLPEEAFENYQKAAEISTDNIRVYARLSNFYYRHGENEKALEALNAVTELAKKNNDKNLLAESLKFKVSIARKTKKFNVALDNLKEIIFLYPSVLNSYFLYAEILINDMRKPKDALKFLNKNKAVMDKYALFYQMNGLALSDLKKCKKAIKYYDKAISMDPNNPNLYINRGICRGESRAERELALQDFNKAQQLAPENPLVYFNRGNIYQDLNNYEQAISDAEKAVSLDASLTVSYLNMTEYAIFENKLDDALFYVSQYKTKTENPAISKSDYKKWIKELKKHKNNRSAEKIQKIISAFKITS